jgi:hypothetical protein
MIGGREDTPIDEALWDEVRFAFEERGEASQDDMDPKELLVALLEHYKKTQWVCEI